MNLYRLLAAAAAIITGIAVHQTEPRTLAGPAVQIGKGSAHVFVELGADRQPTTIGIEFDEGALRGLPAKMNSTSRCFDKNGDGVRSHGECMGDFQFDLALPRGAMDMKLPFKYATVNWNPEGHMEPAPKVWSAPHFDFHFFIVDAAVIDSIRGGPCAELIDCEDFKRATAPLPEQHQPEGYINVGAAVQRMGNHLVDSKDPELADPSLGFSSTFIYGSYDGRLIFLEPMVSHKFLSSQPNRCMPVRGAQSYAANGYYPAEYCVRYNPSSKKYRVTLEGLKYFGV